jgi:predicted GIY-YIG superfamily endonuclease
MHYVYLLRSEADDTWYIGETSDLKRRLSEHNNGKSFYTAMKSPWQLVYYEAFPTKRAAQERERKLKAHGKGLAELKRRIQFG